MKLSVHPGAQGDLTDAVRFYKREAGAGIARRFLAEFERVAILLHEFPNLGTAIAGERRMYRLTAFPYSIIDRRTAIELRLLVVRHQSRDPSHGKLRS